MMNAPESTLDLAQGGGFFTPMKFIAQKGTGLIKDVPFKCAGGGLVDIAVEGKYIVDRSLQAKRIAGTALAGGAVGTGIGVGGYYAVPGRHHTETQMPSIEQLTGLE